MVKVGANIDLTDEHVSRIHLLSSPQETAFLFPQDGTQRRMFSPQTRLVMRGISSSKQQRGIPSSKQKDIDSAASSNALIGQEAARHGFRGKQQYFDSAAGSSKTWIPWQ